MARNYKELERLQAKAWREGVTLAELGRRGGLKTQAKRRRRILKALQATKPLYVQLPLALS